MAAMKKYRSRVLRFVLMIAPVPILPLIWWVVWKLVIFEDSGFPGKYKPRTCEKLGFFGIKTFSGRKMIEVLDKIIDSHCLNLN